MKMIKLLCGFLMLLNFAGKAQRADLLKEEREGVLFMYEEEKLARDVYDSLFAKWEVNPFGNIRGSERMHMAEMKNQILAYLPEEKSIISIKAGSYRNERLQQLYKKCIEKGSVSLVEALKTGALIEETDILDLKEQLKHTKNVELVEAYEFLLKGSEHHLAAFSRRLKAEGVQYEPVLLGKEAYEKMLSGNEAHGCGAQGH